MARLKNIMQSSAVCCLLLLNLLNAAKAEDKFAVPRSQVIELKDETNQLLYPVFIKLPRTYSSQPDKHFPVIYIMDGPYGFQLASGATRFPMNSGAMEQAILVGIGYSKGSRGPASRIRDYTPNKAENWKYETGDADNYAAFLKNTVIAHMEKHYRADPKRLTFVGNSLGGLLGAHILFTQPDLFSSYIIGSPSTWFDNDFILRQPMSPPRALTKVYIAVGSLEQKAFGQQEDMVTGAKAMVKKITDINSPHIEMKFHIIDGARHATAFPTTLIQGLDWLYKRD